MLLGRAGLLLTLVRKAHGFALGCEAGYLFGDFVTDCPGETGQPNSRPLGVIIRRNSSGGRRVTRTIAPSGVLTSAIRAHQLALPIPSIAVPRLALVLGLSLAVLSEGAADIHYLVKPTLFVPTHIPLVSPGIDQLALACCNGCNLQLSLFAI